MKFDAPATANPIDRMRVVGQPVDRVEGPLKTTGQARYAYEAQETAPGAAVTSSATIRPLAILAPRM